MSFSLIFGLIFCLHSILFVSGRLLVGEYIPQRDPDGNLLSKQCHGSTGFCWCIGIDGEQLGAAVGPGVPLTCH